MHAKFQLSSMQNEKVLNHDSTQKEPLAGQIGKIMGKLKHIHNAFPELQIRFFHKRSVIWSFPLSFNEFHHNSTLSKFQVQFWTIKNQEKIYNKMYVPLSFSKYNETSQKLVYSQETSVTGMHARYQDRCI